MPKPLRFPPPDVVPAGPRREFLEELFSYYRDAGRPTLAAISQHIDDGDYAGTASRETVRRTLSGAVPPRWSTVEAIFRALCEIAGNDPSEFRWEPDWNTHESGPTRREHLRQLWNSAVDEGDDVTPAPRFGSPAANYYTGAPEDPPF